MAVLTELRPTVVWSRPYRRAIQTIQPTAAALGLPVRTHAQLREWNDGLAYADDWEPHDAQSWANQSYALPGGESLEQLRTRAVDILRTFAHRHHGQVVLVAGHGTFMAQALTGFGRPMDRSGAQRMPMPAIYRLRFTGLTAHSELPEFL